jgi:sensor c-di-GMP phosphodiesterase-like protein
MSGFISILISSAHQKGVRLVLFLVTFGAMLALASWFIVEQVQQNMRQETARALTGYEQLRVNVLGTFDQMDARLVTAPCSPGFMDELRRIAFLPDGINELLYAPGGMAVCSVNSGLFTQPVDLGAAEVVTQGPHQMAFWLDRDLSFLRLEGLTASIAQRGSFALVVPTPPLPTTTPRWLEMELIVRASNGRWWHRGGQSGIYNESLEQARAGGFGLFNAAQFVMRCDSGGVHCLVGKARLPDLFALGMATIAVTLVVCAVLAAWLSQQAHGFIARHWSFETRFLRRLGPDTIECVYQPLLHLKRDRIPGCEVLARWRDIDGTLVSPDRFIPLIEKHGLTQRFTTLVADRAHKDLTQHLKPGLRVHVSFNIFPRDLQAEPLLTTFAPFLAPGGPFSLIFEIVETQEIQLETAQAEIERLRSAGVRIFIDDFGAGYSSMGNLAAVSVDGVKLDRSFAMAPNDSVLVRMLDHAIDMVSASDRIVVVEGVETQARLDALRANGKVDYVQGYLISRPLDIAGFIAFLSANGPKPTTRPRLVA